MSELDPLIQPESFRDRLGTVDAEGARKWVYANQPKGRFYNWRSYLSYFYLAIFFTLPLIKVNGNPLFLAGIIDRKFILFGAIFWPQDFFIFMLGMLTFMVFIILFTVVFGRVFCGWVCPQTIFMEMVFRKIEYAIEGDAEKQKRRAKDGWTKERIRLRTLKLIAFFLISFLISNTFLSYIIGFDEVKKIATEPISDHLGGFFSILIFTGVFLLVYTFVREQVCTIVCPYGRLQGVLLDKKSIIVAYDYLRGEPRGHDKKNAEKTHGDCVDCGLCVRVCPTSIDIRNGTQLECINCTACIDACDSIMDKVGTPRGLIRYDSEDGISKNEKLRFTPRIKAYSFVLFILAAIEATLLITRTDVDATIMRAQGQLFQKVDSINISNLYNIEILNKSNKTYPITLKLEDMNGTIKVVGKDMILAPESEIKETFFVVVPENQLKQRKTNFKISVYSGDEKLVTAKSTFFGQVQ